MSNVSIDTRTHSISTEAEVSSNQTVQFLGSEWYCPGAQPGWRVMLTTVNIKHDHSKGYPEAEWKYTNFHCAASPGAEHVVDTTTIDIIERLADEAVHSIYCDTTTEITGFAHRLASIN